MILKALREPRLTETPFELFHIADIKEAFKANLIPELGNDKARALWVKFVDDLHVIRQEQKDLTNK